jgi:SAM domain (Sterile alpha motif)
MVHVLVLAADIVIVIMASQQQHPYRSMSSLGTNSHAQDEQEISNYHEWDAQRLGVFFRKKGLGDYQDLLVQHKLTGHLAPLLSDGDLKDMGIGIVGDRLLFRHVIQQLSRRERFHKRITSLWDGQEQVFFSPAEENCMTLCGFCPIDPSTYKLTTSHLRVKKVQPIRCGPIRLTCCFGASYVSNNIDLSKVDDVDVMGIPAPCVLRVCCCANGKDLVEVESRFLEKNHYGNNSNATAGGKVFLQLPEGHGEAVANLILNQVEESQKMERA